MRFLIRERYQFPAPSSCTIATCDGVGVPITPCQTANLLSRWSKKSRVADGEELTTPHLRWVR
jgi:hypothetical protein